MRHLAWGAVRVCEHRLSCQALHIQLAAKLGVVRSCAAVAVAKLVTIPAVSIVKSWSTLARMGEHAPGRK